MPGVVVRAVGGLGAYRGPKQVRVCQHLFEGRELRGSM